MRLSLLLRSALLCSGLPAAFWLYACMCAVYILKRMPIKTRDRGWITPHEYLTGDRTLEIFEYGGARSMRGRIGRTLTGLAGRS